MPDQTICSANNLAIQRLIEKQVVPADGTFSPDDDHYIWTYEDACVTAKRVRNRYKLVPDAETFRYEFIQPDPDQNWAFSVTAIWRNGRLLAPLAVNTTIQDYWPYEGADTSDDEIVLRVNEWLRSLCL